MANKPIHTLNAGRIKVAFWKNTTRDGKSFYTYTLSRLYKSEPNGSWQSVATFGLRDMARLLAAIVAADEWIRERLRNDGEPVADSGDSAEGA